MVMRSCSSCPLMFLPQSYTQRMALQWAAGGWTSLRNMFKVRNTTRPCAAWMQKGPALVANTLQCSCTLS